MSPAPDSPFHRLDDGNLTSVPGFYSGADSAGIKTAESAFDVGMLYSERRCRVAGVFSRNAFPGAPLILTREHLSDDAAQALVVNSGCANTYTGVEGIRDARRMADVAAERLAVPVRDVLVASTGLIGAALPIERVVAAIERLQLAKDRGHAFAEAIMTTDTHPKELAVELEMDGATVRIAGVAKGSGMIHPDMATMFCFLVTDAALSPKFQQSVLTSVADRSLNMVTVDGDTSPDDMMLLWSNGIAGNDPIQPGSSGAATFTSALIYVAASLARQIARDGEGATRLIEVTVRGASSYENAARAARSVVASPLVKAAIHGCDPNWGRIISAVGQSRAAASLDAVRLTILGHTLFAEGTMLEFDEAALSAAMSAETVTIEVEIGEGEAAATAWGCDLSAEYVRINADYTT